MVVVVGLTEPSSPSVPECLEDRLLHGVQQTRLRRLSRRMKLDTKQSKATQERTRRT